LLFFVLIPKAFGCLRMRLSVFFLGTCRLWWIVGLVLGGLGSFGLLMGLADKARFGGFGRCLFVVGIIGFA